MVKRTRFTLCLVAVTATIAAAAVPLAGAEDSESTITTCSGGETDPWAAPVAGTEDTLFSWDDASLWKDDNGVPGLQRTDRTCIVTDSSYRVVDSYVEYPADSRMA